MTTYFSPLSTSGRFSHVLAHTIDGKTRCVASFSGLDAWDEAVKLARELNASTRKAA